MDIVELLQRAKAWQAEPADVARVIRAIEKAEDRWNATHDNTALVVVKIIVGADLLAIDNGEPVQTFIATLPPEAQ